MLLAKVIGNVWSTKKKDEILLNLPSGQVSIEISQLDKKGDSNLISKNKPCLLSKQKNPEFGRIYEPVLLSKILGLEPQDFDKNFQMYDSLNFKDNIGKLLFLIFLNLFY